MSLALFPLVGIIPTQYKQQENGTFVKDDGSNNNSARGVMNADSMLLGVERRGEHYKVLYMSSDAPITINTSSFTWCHSQELEVVKFPCFFIVNDTLDSNISVSVRAEPSPTAVGECSLTPGDIVFVHSVNGDWMEVSLQDNDNDKNSNSKSKSNDFRKTTTTATASRSSRRFYMMKQTASGIILLLPYIPLCFKKSATLPLSAGLRQRVFPTATSTAIDIPYSGRQTMHINAANTNTNTNTSTNTYTNTNISCASTIDRYIVCMYECMVG